MAWYNNIKDAGKTAQDGVSMYYDPTGLISDNPISDRLWGKKDKGPKDPQAQLDAIIADMVANNDAAIAEGRGIYDQGYQAAKYSGDFNPQDLDPNSLARLEDSALANISVDPRFRATELQALDALEQRSQSGLTPEDEAALAGIARDAARTNRGNQAAIQSNFAQRGIGGAGMEFAARQQAAQDAAEMEAIRGLEVAAMAQRNKQAAVNDMANLAGQMGNTDYARAAQAAQAQDLINRFNTQNQVGVQQANHAARLGAQQNNLNRQDNMSQFNASGMNNFNQNRVDFAVDAAGLKNQGNQMRFDSTTDAYNRAAARAAANNEARANRKGAIFGAGGAVLGGIYGGPGGAQAGASAGSALGKFNT